MIKIFADDADYDSIVKLAKNPLIKGFTTNPTLMRKAGVTDCEAFARKVLEAIPYHSISFEVFADDFHNMAKQARKIAKWGPNVNVKIPVTNTKGEPSYKLVNELSSEGIVVNVTAVFTLAQVWKVADALGPGAAIVSVFAGRIADTGVDPVPHMRQAKHALHHRPMAQLLWASTREILNIKQAEECGCDIITVPGNLLDKLALFGKDLTVYSRETVQDFHHDALAAGYFV
jgi:transaldolase